jgi:hypothetical protein
MKCLFSSYKIADNVDILTIVNTFIFKIQQSKTPLMIAVERNHEQVVAFLLLKGADPKLKGNGFSAFELAKTPKMTQILTGKFFYHLNIFDPSKYMFPKEGQLLSPPPKPPIKSPAMSRPVSPNANPEIKVDESPLKRSKQEIPFIKSKSIAEGFSNSSNLPIEMSEKYYNSGMLDFEDTLVDGFYDGGRGLFQALSFMEKSESSREVIIVDKKRDLRLAEIVEKSQEFLKSFEDLELKVKMLAVFVSNIMGGSQIDNLIAEHEISV